MTCKKHLGGTVWAALLVFVSCGSGTVPARSLRIPHSIEKVFPLNRSKHGTDTYFARKGGPPQVYPFVKVSTNF